MAKTNFTKAEEALSEALQKMTVEQLLQEAGSSSPSADQQKKAKAREQIVKTLQRDLKRAQKEEAEVNKKLGIKRKELEELMADPSKLSAEDWEKIVAVKAKLDEFFKTLPPKTVSNEDLVQQARTKHITKRFNVNDKWLPLK